MIRRRKEKLFKYQLLATAFSVFGIVLIMTGSSFAFFESTSKADEYNSIKVGNLELSYVDTGEGLGDVLSLNGAYPISDEEGMAKSPYRFHIKNTGTILADFKIKIKNDEAIIGIDCCKDINIDSDECRNKLLKPEYIKYQLDNNEPVKLSTKEESDYTIYEVKNMVAGSSEIHELRIWIAEDATNEVLGKHYHGKVVLEGIQGGTDDSLASIILLNNDVVNIDEENHPETKPTLTTTSDAANEKGLYVSYETNSKKPTYYFRGAVENNWVRFADNDWRIVRINEDESIRLIIQDGINKNGDDTPLYVLHETANYADMYYSNWTNKTGFGRYELNNWYDTHIANNENYISQLSESMEYFCEAAKVVSVANNKSRTGTTFMELYNDYIPTFKCENDENGKGIVSDNKVGLLTYDEVIFAGAYYSQDSNFYLNNNTAWWTISGAGLNSGYTPIWRVNIGNLGNNAGNEQNGRTIRPVINLKADTKILSGNGTESNKYVIKTTTE